MAGSDVDVSYRFDALNDRLISVNLENGAYNYGAAHPNEYVDSFHWWLELGRALKAEDVFRPGSGWETFLTKRRYEILRSGEHAGDLYAEAREAIAESVTEVTGCKLDARKFEVNFAEYSVAPRAAGPISAELGWDELKPYFANGFNPATLPQPIGPRAR